MRLGSGLHIIGSHYILLDTPSTALVNLRSLQSRVFQPVTVAFAPIAAGIAAIPKWISTHSVTGSALTADLPVNVDLMTLQVLDPTNLVYLLRLSHQFAVSEDPSLSMPVTVDLTTLFKNLKVVSAEEVSLTANQPAKNIKPFMWQVKGKNAEENSWERSGDFDGSSVTIDPMDIRTFKVTFAMA